MNSKYYFSGKHPLIIIPPKIKGIMDKLEAEGFESYVIGGAIRDTLSDIEPNDWDIFTNAKGEEILKLFKGGVVIGGQERQKKILTVIYQGVEISTYRSNPDRTGVGSLLTEHIHTCDFTINAVACNSDGEIVDIVGGIDDIRYGNLSCVGIPEERFTEDPLRVLRAIRFKSKGFKPASRLTGKIKEWIPKLKTLPIERIREEMIKIMKEPQGCSNLAECGFFKHFIPDLEAGEDIDGGEHHQEDIFTHCLKSFEATHKVTDDYRIWLASLFHDIGKVGTITVDETGTHFYGHDRESVLLAIKILTDFKFSKEDIKFITTLIGTHMFGYSDNMTDKGLRRFIVKLNEANINIWQWLAMRYGDNQGNLSKPRVKPYDFQYKLIEDYYRLKYSDTPLTIKDLKVSGKDLIDRGEKAGKIIGYYLEQLFDSVENAYVRNVKLELLLLFEAMKEQWENEYEVKNGKK